MAVFLFGGRLLSSPSGCRHRQDKCQRRRPPHGGREIRFHRGDRNRRQRPLKRGGGSYSDGLRDRGEQGCEDRAEKQAALILVSDVLTEGIEIGAHTNHKGRDKSTVTFAAPVK